MEGVDVPEGKMPFQVANERQLRPFLKKMAEDIRNHARAAVAGDRMFFRRLEAFRSTQSQKYMRDMKLQRVRSEAALSVNVRETGSPPEFSVEGRAWTST